MYVVSEFLSVFWSPKFWLAPGLTWEQLEPKYEYDYTNYRHLYLYPIPLAIGILIFRFALEKYCFCRLGLTLGLKNVKNKRAPPHPVLEKAFKANSKLNHKDITALSKQTDYTERKIERWLRLRRMQGKPSTLYKFSESCWRCFYYFNLSIYGLVTLWSKPWFWDLDKCWVNYPHQGFSSDIWLYYMISLAFYWSLLISQFVDTKRKDFWHMCTHHVITIILLSFSWVCNAYRIGSVLLVTHDYVDAILDAGKAAKYAKCERLCNILFVFFVISWIATKLIYYPFWILHNTIIRAPVVASQMFPAYYFFNALLIALLLLHLYWTYLISKLVLKTLAHGKDLYFQILGKFSELTITFSEDAFKTFERQKNTRRHSK